MRMLLPVLAFVAATGAVAQTPQQPFFNVITLEASATADVPTDTLTVTLFTEEQGSDPGALATRVNAQMVDLDKLSDPNEIEELWKLIQRHQTYTKSERAAKILGDWDGNVNRFVKVIPKDFKRVLKFQAEMKEKGLTGDEAVMAAFEANVRDVARVGGG